VDEQQRKKNIRRTTLIVAAVALAFFVGFIMLAVMRS